MSDGDLALLVDFKQSRKAGEAVLWVRLAVAGCTACWARFNALRWERARGSPEVAELRAYMGGRFREGYDGTMALAGRWRELDPRTPEDVSSFYGSADDYVYDLTLFHASGERMDYPSALAGLAREHDCGSALDYGCGTGSDGLRLIESGLDATFMDFDNASTEYLRWRLRRRGLDEGRLVFVGDEIPPADLVYALDIFEHLAEPETMAEVLAARTGRLLVYNVLFHVDSDTMCPMHLNDRDPAETIHAIDDRLSSVGMRRISDDPLLTAWAR